MSKFKEPWKIAGIRGDQIVDECGDFRVGVTLNMMGDPCTENAARIVTCVNAMEGIDDPAAARVVLDLPQTEHANEAIELLEMCRAIFHASLNEGTLKRDALARIDALLDKVKS